MNNIRSFGLEIMVTNNCNYRCSYCIESEFDDCLLNLKEKRCSNKDIYNFIDNFLDSSFFKDNYNILDIHLWGGEPTLDTNFIIDIVNRYMNHNNVIFMTSTNGYKIDKLLNFLNNSEIQNKNKYGRNFFTLQISYDGKIINDIKRKTSNNESGTQYTLDSIKYAKDNNLNYSLKSTITYDTLKYIYDAYYDIVHVLNEPAYFPTIDYRIDIINSLTEDDIENYFVELKKGLFKIAKDEFNYIKENKYSRFVWFNINKAECCAGADMLCIDLNGKIYSCHGCLTIPSKESHCSGSIFDENAIDLITKKRSDYYNNMHIINEICKNCDSVFCLKCNASKYQSSNKNNYYDRWFDYNSQPNLCKFYKYISNVARAINIKIFSD